MLAEFSDVLRRPRFQEMLARSAIRPNDLSAELQRLVELFDPQPLAARISRDPDDDAVLSLAATSQADLIVTGDADLLVISQFDGIRIVNAAEALRIIKDL